jgi:uncharacterized protein GlcG (DUF336 family)
MVFPMLTLAIANRLIEAAFAEGRKRNLQPLTVAVLDAGGHVVSLQREDGSSLMRPQIATAKAWGTLGMGFGGRELARRAAAGPVFFGALIELAGGNMVPVQGGVIVRDAAGKVLGAVGVTGDLSAQDEACALAGIAAVGLVADPGGEV